MTYDPGADAALRYPDWTIVRRPLQGAHGAALPARRLILVDSTAPRAEQQATLAHELVHLDRGDQCATGCSVSDVKREVAVHAEAARRLIPLERLRAALMWGRDEHEYAQELGVDLETLHARVEHLTVEEREALRDAAATRDWGAA